MYLRREDLNLRMAESKSAALPLGDAPKLGLYNIMYGINVINASMIFFKNKENHTYIRIYFISLNYYSRLILLLKQVHSMRHLNQKYYFLMFPIHLVMLQLPVHQLQVQMRIVLVRKLRMLPFLISYFLISIIQLL